VIHFTMDEVLIVGLISVSACVLAISLYYYDKNKTIGEDPLELDKHVKKD
jgi:hypothetical protein